MVGPSPTSELPRRLLIEHLVGWELPALTATAPPAPGPKWGLWVLVLRGAGARRSVGGLSFGVGRGEAVGLSGLLGSGRTEACRVIFALDPADTGEMRVRGKSVRPRDPKGAINLGMALCPEDRREQGIIGGLSLRENLVLALQARRGWWRRIGAKAETALARKAVDELKITTAGLETPIENLSGGNQQKAILARWLATDPELLILDEPTRGIDIGAHAEILNLIRALCGRGMALVVASSELEELVAFSHRVVVLRDRVQVAELEGATISEHNIMRAIAETP
jgi:simple sugar transport system ATP-binding protein